MIKLHYTAISDPKTDLRFHEIVVSKNDKPISVIMFEDDASVQYVLKRLVKFLNSINYNES